MSKNYYTLLVNHDVKEKTEHVMKFVNFSRMILIAL